MYQLNELLIHQHQMFVMFQYGSYQKDLLDVEVLLEDGHALLPFGPLLHIRFRSFPQAC